MTKPNPKTDPDGRIVTRATFAWNCGCTEQTLRRFIAAGMPGALPDGRIEVRAAHSWLVERQAKRVAAKAVKESGGRSATDLKRAVLAIDLKRKTLAEEGARLDLAI